MGTQKKYKEMSLGLIDRYQICINASHSASIHDGRSPLPLHGCLANGHDMWNAIDVFSRNIQRAGEMAAAVT